MVRCRMAAPTFLKAPCLRLLPFLHDNSSFPDIIQDALPAHTTLSICVVRNVPITK